MVKNVFIHGIKEIQYVDVGFFIQFENKAAFYAALDEMFPDDVRDIFVMKDRDVFINGTAVFFYDK